MSPDRALRPCRNPGCPAVTRKIYCEKHLKHNSASDDATDALYQTVQWKHFRKWFRQMNPACQKLTDGQLCHRPAIFVHHLISPRTRPDLLLVVSNCVSLCRPHHPVSSDTPFWREGIDFSKSKGEVDIV